MDCNIVLSYDYSNWNWRRRRTDAPPLRAISMAGGALVQYEAHLPMQHDDQGFTESHWTPSSSDYLPCIAQAAARATIKTTMIQHVPTLLAISMAMAMRRSYNARIAQWRRSMAFIKATKCRHRASTHSDITNRTHQRWLFRTFHCKKKSSSWHVGP